MTDAFRDTFLDRWPAALRRLSFATAFVPLDDDERANLEAAWYIANGAGAATKDAAWTSLEAKVQAALDQFPNGAFVRLASRSPKDSWVGIDRGFRCAKADDVFRLFEDSERIHDDLSADRRFGRPSFIAVREWRDIPRHEEWRVFIKERRIVGMSQYDHFTAYPELAFHEKVIRWVMDEFFTRPFGLRDSLTVDPVIADVWLAERNHGDHTTVHEPKLIEINPWGAWTDPCLFDWQDVDTWATREPYEVRTRVKGEGAR